MSKLRILQICHDGSWVKPLIQVLEPRANVRLLYPTDKERTQEKMTEKIASVYRERIEQFAPDIIHVHGTENNFGQLQHYFPNIPVVVSIQGVLTGCIPHATAQLTRRNMLPYWTLKNLFHKGGLMQFHRTIMHGSKTFEEDILRSCRYFFCRTDWDRMWVRRYNPNAHIYQGEELLRPTFYVNAGQWQKENAVKHSIFMPSGFNPIKGLHHAIKALYELKTTYPDIMLRVPGIPQNIYSRRGLVYRICGEEYLGYIRHLTESLQVKNHIVFLPRLTAEEMAEEMLHANVFLSPSSIDNSPNAVGEAMMLGVPIVCTPVGGVPSFVHHEENGLLAEPDTLATAISRIFDDSALAETLGSKAYQTALRRHDKAQTADQYMSAYYDIMNDKKSSSYKGEQDENTIHI